MLSINHSYAAPHESGNALVDFNLRNKIVATRISFQELVQKFNALLTPFENLTTDQIDADLLKKCMSEYTSTESDWLKYALYEASYNYTRNLVVNFGKNANLLVLVWGPGRLLPIHNHANAHCCVKVLKGQLTESLYEYPEKDGPMTLAKTTTLNQNDVAYISDEMGLHRMSNPLQTEVAVSLHLYTPPYAALYGCEMYDERTGKTHHVDTMKYYSWEGKKLE